jgi:hypothetical protein
MAGEFFLVAGPGWLTAARRAVVDQPLPRVTRDGSIVAVQNLRVRNLRGVREAVLMERTYAYRQMEAARVAENLLPIGNIPRNEAQARKLARTEPEQEQLEVAAGDGSGKQLSDSSTSLAVRDATV